MRALFTRHSGPDNYGRHVRREGQPMTHALEMAILRRGVMRDVRGESTGTTHRKEDKS